MKSWFGYGLRADTKYEIPVAFSVTRASRAETKELSGDKLETPLLRCKDFSAHQGQRVGEAAGPVRPVARASPEEKNDPDKPLFDDNVYRRGEVLVLKPALGGAGFEADRGACGTLKCRCPAAAFDCAAERKECCRARQADEPSASTSMTAGFSRRPWGSSSWKRGPPFRPGSTAGSTTPAEKHCRHAGACGPAS